MKSKIWPLFLSILHSACFNDGSAVAAYCARLPGRCVSIASISPSDGSVRSGTPVTVVGSRFVPDVAVTVGDAPLAEIIVIDEKTILGKTPPGESGPVDVVVSATKLFENSRASS